MNNSLGLSFFSLFTVPIVVDEKEKVLEYVLKRLNEGKEITVIYTPNPEILHYASQHPEFAEVVRTAQINLPDGWGVVWAIRRLGGPTIPRLAGVDFVQFLAEKAADQGLRVALFGGRSDVALSTKECLTARLPKLDVVVVPAPQIDLHDLRSQTGAVGEQIHHLARTIREQEISIVFVALGFPKQEYVIAALRAELIRQGIERSCVLMAVGGSLDYIAGAVPRAPRWMRDRGGEWLFRLVREPWRWKRQLAAIPFFWEVMTKRS